MNTTMLKQLKWEQKRIFIATFGLFVTVALVFLALGVWAWVGTLEESIPGIGQMAPEGKLRRIMAPVGGKVAKVYVKENDEVKKGQVLIELDPESVDVEVRSSHEQLDLLRREQLALEAAAAGANVDWADLGPVQSAWLAATKQAYQAQMMEAETNIEQAQHTYLEAQQRLKQVKEILAASEKMLPGHRQLYEDGGLSEKELREYEQEVYQNRGNVAAQEERVLADAKALQSARQKPDQIVGSFRQEILARVAQHQQQVAQLRGDADRSLLSKKYQVIRAPMDGVINEQVFRGAGEVVQAGQTLMNIVPDDMGMVAEVRVANRDLAYVHLNQKALLRLDAFPYQHFGRLYGTVVAISPSTLQGVDPTGEVSGNHQAEAQAAQQPFYVLSIKPDKKFMEFEGKRYDFRSGMTLTADIITREKNILSFFTEPIKDHVRKAFKDPTNR